MMHSLQAALGYQFKDANLLTEALTHPTFANESVAPVKHYERLEFLGDALVGAYVAQALYLALPGASEGELSRRRAQVIRKQSLARLADALCLAQHLRLGRSLVSLPAGPGDTVLADAFEALVGALYLDGGWGAATPILTACFAQALAATGADRDSKTELQEAAHRLGMPQPVYVLLGSVGPDHARIYTSQVTLGSSIAAEGAGTSKKAAEQVCASRALDKLEHLQNEAK